MTETDRAADDARILREHGEAVDRARAVFGGLAPRMPVRDTTAATAARVAAVVRADRARRVRSSAFTAVPVVLTGAIALSLGLTGPVDPAHARKPQQMPKPTQSPNPAGLRTALAQLGAAITPGGFAAAAVTTAAAPAVYVVEAGDTVSGIAQRFGLSTASVLALNGLSWKSVIFPGQELRLTSSPVKTTGLPAPVTVGGRYTIVKGDTVSALAARFGLSTQAILDANGLSWKSIIYPGQTIVIPGQSATPYPVADRALPSEGAPEGDVVESADLDEAGASASESDADGERPAEAATRIAAMAIAESPTPAAPPARPSSGSSGSPARPPAGGSITPLTAEGRQHAATIIQVGRQLGVPDYGIVIALATAMQESSMRNLSWGDRDSVGLFQQRPSSGWGTAAELQVPSHAARLFYVGRPGYTRGLLQIPGWQNMTLTQAAQAVQISAYPNHYAKWEASAWAWFDELG